MGVDLQVGIGEIAGGMVELPASKSISNRVLVIDALSGGGNHLENIAVCDDTEAIKSALRNYRYSNGGVLHVDVGAAGTAMRFLTAYFAMQEGLTVVLDGSARMRQRPVSVLVDALRSCGAVIAYLGESGYPPLEIRGRRLSANGGVAMDCGVSSQFISAMMMVAPMMESGLHIDLTGDAVSTPYLWMTAEIMRRFGARVDFGDGFVDVATGGYKTGVDYRIENDWSAASYWYELKSLLPKARISLPGLQADSIQGDSTVSRIFNKFGVITEFDTYGVAVLGYDPALVSERIDMDLTDCPDLAQTIAVTSCLKGIPFRLSGLRSLRIKETDRISALVSQLSRLGYDVRDFADNSIEWTGRQVGNSIDLYIDTCNDHRMAMAFAPAAVKFPGLVIADSGVVGKSYPGYWEQLSKIGFNLSVWKGR